MLRCAAASSLLAPLVAAAALAGCGAGGEAERAGPGAAPEGEAGSAAAGAAGSGAAAEVRVLVVPPRAENPPWLERRAQAQRQAARDWSVFSDFRFRDRIAESGIAFRQRITDDSGREYKDVHYDHGNGLAAADVDGDGRTDLYFVNQLGGNELWRNLGGGRFEDVTGQAGVALKDRISVGASFADIDNDGDADLYVTTVRGGNALFENDGGGRFADISAPSGLDYTGHSSGAVFFDFDRDGRLDLFLANIGRYTTDAIGRGGYYIGFEDAFAGHLKPERAERSRLYRNLGGNRFADVSDAVGLVDERWSGDAVAADLNGDGFPDLYVLNMQGLDGYWQNEGGKRFVDRSAEVFPRTPWGSMGGLARDFDNDGDLDLFITDMHSDMSESVAPKDEKRKANMQFPPSFLADGGRGIYGNAYFRNDGGVFREVSDEVGAENFWPWGPSAGDLNADGFEDVFVASSMNYRFRYAINSALLNDRGRFLDAEFVLGVEPRRGGRTVTPWFELDCGGEDRGHELCAEAGEGAGRVQVMGALGTRSAVIFDLEGDGDLDIVTSDFNSEPMVLVSDLSERRPVRFLRVKLSGSKSNRSGIGARVRVRAGEDWYTQVLDGRSGYLSQSLLPLTFGLGDHPAVDEVQVLWPSGREQRVPGPIPAGSLLEIEEKP